MKTKIMIVGSETNSKETLRKAIQGLSLKSKKLLLIRGNEINREKYQQKMQWALKVSRELHNSFVAENRLRDKCNWEKMGRTAVILEWGDPREWKETK